MFCLNLKNSKSGHPKMQTPIMLCFKARGIHTASPGNSYCLLRYVNYIKLSLKNGENMKNEV
jgi:hypothetical protein